MNRSGRSLLGGEGRAAVPQLSIRVALQMLVPLFISAIFYMHSEQIGQHLREFLIDEGAVFIVTLQLTIPCDKRRCYHWRPSGGDRLRSSLQSYFERHKGVVMKMQRNIHTVRICMASFLLALAPIGMSQTVSAGADSNEVAADNVPLLVAQRIKSRSQLRREYHNAEEDFYTLFNTLNSSDEFDVTCESKVPLGGRRKERACKAAFLWAYEADMARDYNDRIEGTGSGAAPNAGLVERKQEDLRAQMSTAIAENPELNQAFAKLAAAKRDYEAKR